MKSLSKIPGLPAHAQGHDLGDVEPSSEAPGDAKGEHVHHDHGHDGVARSFPDVAGFILGKP